MARKVWHDHGMRTQVTFDCADPHAQAAFWAAMFGSQVEDHSELVDQLVAAGRLPAEDSITMAEVVSTVGEAVWTELEASPSRRYTAADPFISSLRRNLQAEHVDRLIGMSQRGSMTGAAARPRRPAPPSAR